MSRFNNENAVVRLPAQWQNFNTPDKHHLIIEKNDTLLEDHAIIPPPPIRSKHKQKTDIYKIIIDSRDRNIILYPSPAKYSVKLDTPINDVVGIQLSDYNIPFSRTIINNTNKTLKYSIDSGATIKSVTLTEGNLTGTEIATELKLRIGIDISSVDYDLQTDKLTFNSINNNFKLIFSNSVNDKNNLYSVLGFLPVDYQASGLKIIAPYMVNLDADNYLIMKLENAITNISNNDTINKSFAIIKNSILSDELIKKNFNPPLNNFSTFNIEFCDYYGNLIDFNNREHRLEFQIETLSKTENIFI
jgi:hypothetical protein